MSERELAVSELTGKIYDAVMSKKEKGVMTSDRTDRTSECICAVSEHMRVMAGNEEGFEYAFKGFGTLTWKNEVTE